MLEQNAGLSSNQKTKSGLIKSQIKFIEQNKVLKKEEKEIL